MVDASGQTCGVVCQCSDTRTARKTAFAAEAAKHLRIRGSSIFQRTFPRRKTSERGVTKRRRAQAFWLEGQTTVFDRHRGTR